MLNNIWLVALLVSLFTGLSVGGLLYAFGLFSNPEQARVARRVKKYVDDMGEHDSNGVGAGHALLPAASGQRQRAKLFEELDKRWESKSLFRSLQRDIEAAGLNTTTSELTAVQVGVGLALTLLAWLLLSSLALLLAPLCIFVGVFVVRWVVRYKAKRRMTQFEDQLPDNLAILAGSVRGGFSLFQALNMISREAAEPSKGEFIKVIQEISLGNPMSAALEGLSQRVPTEDVDILVTAISMQQQTGGNLTHVLDVVAATVRERHRVKREIKSLTAQQRFSAILLAALPFMLGAVLFVISPRYIGKLFQPGWVLCMPIGAFVTTVIGFIVMRKLADIDV